MKNRFYLACFRDNVGSSVSFHRHEFSGYHTDIDQAQVLTLEEAQHEYNSAREYDQPISADHVDALAVWKVDHQKLPNESQLGHHSNCYVAFERGVWDGNDVWWLSTDTCQTSTDFNSASVIGRSRAESLGEKYIVVPFELASNAARRTFDFSKFNARTMVQGAGLKIPDDLNKARRRNNNPKTRFNRPACGKISWQFNPHDFDGCLDVWCDEWSAA